MLFGLQPTHCYYSQLTSLPEEVELRHCSLSSLQIKVQDCVPLLKQYVSDGVVFDYVISDLTAAPISTDPNG